MLKSGSLHTASFLTGSLKEWKASGGFLKLRGKNPAMMLRTTRTGENRSINSFIKHDSTHDISKDTWTKLTLDLIDFCILMTLNPVPFPFLYLWRRMNKQWTYCKLDLTATHDVVQERVHLVDLRGGKETRWKTAPSFPLQCEGLNFRDRLLNQRKEQKEICGQQMGQLILFH